MLFITQAYWFKKAFDLEERQFDERVNIALRNVADGLLSLDHDTTSRIAPILKRSSNEFYVKTSCYYSLSTLDSCLRAEFSLRNMKIDFDYQILNAENNMLLLGNTLLEISDPDDIACKSRVDKKQNLNFNLRINHKTAYLISSMAIWMFSSISLLLILAIFTFVMISIIRGRKLENLKKDFVNNMTHELKTPIANISVASDAILQRNIEMDEQKLKKYAGIIHKENNRLHQLVDKALQLSSIEKKEESLYVEKIDLHEIIKEVSLSFEPLIQKRNGKIQSKLMAKKSHLIGDKIHLSNVLYNLIDNAIKYSSTNPEITIKTYNNNESFYLEIADKGIGINKESQTRVFEKFYRVETGNIHNTRGYGLGLSYVKLIVEKHLGSITFVSKENMGSTFTLYLPI